MSGKTGVSGKAEGVTEVPSMCNGVTGVSGYHRSVRQSGVRRKCPGKRGTAEVSGKAGGTIAVSQGHKSSFDEGKGTTEVSGELATPQKCLGEQEHTEKSGKVRAPLECWGRRRDSTGVAESAWTLL